MRAGLTLRGMGMLLALSMAVTEGMLIWQGRWKEAIPLHLCSISAIMAFAAAIGIRRKGLIDFLWYLGLPGALLALVFPSPAASRCQMFFTASYFVTHLLIVLIPLVLMYAGTWPQTGMTLRVMLILQGIVLLAAIVNDALGTNFLFLSVPPAGTPLEHVYRMGRAAYFVILETIMLSLCFFQERTLKAAARYARKIDD